MIHQSMPEKGNANQTSPLSAQIDGLRAFAVAAVVINHFNKEILPEATLVLIFSLSSQDM